MRVRRFQLFGHVKRKEEGEAPPKVNNWQVEGRHPRGKPKKSWMNVIQDDVMKLGINEDLTSDRRGMSDAITV